MDTRPITLEDFEEAIDELPNDTITSVKHQLENSVAKLKATNLELQQEIEKLVPLETNEAQTDVKLYKDVIKENEQVISNQMKRIESVDRKLKDRGLLKDSSQELSEGNENNHDNGIYL